MKITLTPQIVTNQGFEYLYKLEDIVKLNPLRYYTNGCATDICRISVSKGDVTVFTSPSYPKDNAIYTDESLYKGLSDSSYLVDVKARKVIYSESTGILSPSDFSIFPIANKGVIFTSWLVLSNENKFYRFYAKDGMGSVAFFLYYTSEKLLFSETNINKITDVGIDAALRLLCYRFGLDLPTRAKPYEIAKVLTTKKGKSVIPDKNLDEYSTKYFSRTVKVDKPKSEPLLLTGKLNKNNPLLSDIIQNGISYVSDWTEVEMDIAIDGVDSFYTHQGFLYIYTNGKNTQDEIEQQIGSNSDKFIYIKSKTIVD